MREGNGVRGGHPTGGGGGVGMRDGSPHARGHGRGRFHPHPPSSRGQALASSQGEREGIRFFCGGIEWERRDGSPPPVFTGAGYRREDNGCGGAGMMGGGNDGGVWLRGGRRLASKVGDAVVEGGPGEKGALDADGKLADALQGLHFADKVQFVVGKLLAPQQ